MRIKETRKELGITQDELAQRTGYDRTSISKIENGLVDIPISGIEKIAKALDCSPAYLIGWTDERNI